MTILEDIEIAGSGNAPAKKTFKGSFVTKNGRVHTPSQDYANKNMPDLEQETIDLREALMRSDEQAARHIRFDIARKSDVRSLDGEADASSS